MDKEKKIKIILASVFGLLLLFVVYLFMGAGGGDTQREVSARAVDSTEVTIEDIMAREAQAPLGGYASPEPSLPQSTQPSQEPYEDSEEIARLQEQLRANQQRITTTPSTPPPSTPEPRQSNEAQTTETPSVASVNQASSSTQTDLAQTGQTGAVSEATPVAEEAKPQKRSRFNSGIKSKQGNIKVVVLGDQELSNGATLKLVLAQSITLEGTTIPKGTALYGVVRNGAERLQVLVQSITYRDKVYPLRLQAYDRDGLQGINVPEAIPSDNASAKEVAEEVAQRSGLLSGAVGTVVNTATGIFRKRGSSNTIIIKSNYQLTLR